MIVKARLEIRGSPIVRRFDFRYCSIYFAIRMSHLRQPANGKAGSNRISAAKHLSLAGVLPVGMPDLPGSNAFQETRQAHQDKVETLEMIWASKTA
jgi:hypothetical protein